MATDMRVPTARECERCGRRERWDESGPAWRIVEEDGEKQAGDPHCIHEWDINGTFAPFGE